MVSPMPSGRFVLGLDCGVLSVGYSSNVAHLRVWATAVGIFELLAVSGGVLSQIGEVNGSGHG